MTEDEEAEGANAPEEVLAAMQFLRDAERKGVDVYAAYRSAKSQQKNKFKSRGLFSREHPRGRSHDERQQELAQAKATRTCRACGAQGLLEK